MSWSPNVAHGSDGVWRTLDARHLYRHHRTAGFLYQAQLRAELSRRLGLRWQPARCGMAELDGVSEHVVRVFSQRRRQILEHLSGRGLTGARASEVAALDTRHVKTHVPLTELRAEWAQRSAAAGMPARGWGRLLAAGHRRRRGLTARLTVMPPNPRGLAVTLTEQDSTFARRDVIRAVAEAAVIGADVAQIEAATDRFLAGSEVVALGEDVFSTRTHMEIEREGLAAAADRQNAGIAVVPAPTVERAVTGAGRLSGEQEVMVRRITTSGHGVEVVIGHPGSGKTTALAAAARAWTDSGHRVVGAALAARAAAELQTASGIPSSTLASLLHDLEQHRLPANTVVVMDEAGMVGTRDLHRLLAHTAQAKVVLVGDPKQLPEIDAGGAFAALANGLGAVELTDNHRQRDPVERHALAVLRAGRVERALDQMADHGRVTHHPGVDAACRQMIDDWTRHRRNGEQVLLLAGRRHHVAELNQLAQQARLVAGELGDDHLTVAELTVHVGDTVMAQRNEYRYQLLNGQRAVVTNVDADGITVRTDKDVDTFLPRRALETGLLQLGYASTIHKSQGATTDRALVLATDGLGHEAGYTALTRGRVENHLYLTGPPDHHERARELRHSMAKHLAREQTTGIDR